MFATPLSAALLTLTFPLLAAAAQADKEDKARAALNAHLDKIAGAQAGRVAAVTDDAVRRALPQQQIFVVRFRGYPVKPPESFQNSNLFAVASDGAVTRLADAKALKDFARTALSPATTDAEAKANFRVWLRLAEELHQDGYYTFKMDEDSLAVRSRDGRRSVTGTARVSDGGEGHLSGTLTFDRDGKVAEASAEARLKPGARPARGGR